MEKRRIALLVVVVLLIPILPWIVIGQSMEHWISGALEAPATMSRAAVALLGLGLLAGDSFFPVPSTLVMSAVGWALGALWGGLIASAGVFLSGAIAFFACRRFGISMARRIAGEAGIQRLESTLNRVGPLLIAMTRSVPVVQEASACLAGLVRMDTRAFLLALVAGSVPTGFAYAAIGAAALQNRTLAVWLSILLPAASWIVITWIIRRSLDEKPLAPRS